MFSGNIYLRSTLGATQTLLDINKFLTEGMGRVKAKAKSWRGRDFSTLARATVCKLSLTAKSWYMLEVICMPRANVQRMHTVFAIFTWNLSMKRSAGTNLFLSAANGG